MHTASSVWALVRAPGEGEQLRGQTAESGGAAAAASPPARMQLVLALSPSGGGGQSAGVALCAAGHSTAGHSTSPKRNRLVHPHMDAASCKGRGVLWLTAGGWRQAGNCAPLLWPGALSGPPRERGILKPTPFEQDSQRTWTAHGRRLSLSTSSRQWAGGGSTQPQELPPKAALSWGWGVGGWEASPRGSLVHLSLSLSQDCSIPSCEASGKCQQLPCPEGALLPPLGLVHRHSRLLIADIRACQRAGLPEHRASWSSPPGGHKPEAGSAPAPTGPCGRLQVHGTSPQGQARLPACWPQTTLGLWPGELSPAWSRLAKPRVSGQHPAEQQSACREESPQQQQRPRAWMCKA